jgi:hypothetical protein
VALAAEACLRRTCALLSLLTGAVSVALDADVGLAQALNPMYEGTRLEPEHPSLAHLTFVAATEGYGMRLADDAPCDCRPWPAVWSSTTCSSENWQH